MKLGAINFMNCDDTVSLTPRLKLRSKRLSMYGTMFICIIGSELTCFNTLNSTVPSFTSVFIAYINKCPFTVPTKTMSSEIVWMWIFVTIIKLEIFSTYHNLWENKFHHEEKPPVLNAGYTLLLYQSSNHQFWYTNKKNIQWKVAKKRANIHIISTITVSPPLLLNDTASEKIPLSTAELWSIFRLKISVKTDDNLFLTTIFLANNIRPFHKYIYKYSTYLLFNYKAIEENLFFKINCEENNVNLMFVIQSELQLFNVTFDSIWKKCLKRKSVYVSLCL